MFNIVRRIINWSETYKKRMYLGFLFSFINGLFIASHVIFGAVGLEMVIQDLNGSRKLESKDILLVLTLMIISVVGRYIFSYIRAVCQDTIGYERLSKERIDIGNILKRVPLGFFKKNSTGEIVSAVSTDLSFMELHVINMIDNVVNGYITIFIMILSLLFLDIRIAAIALAGVLLSALFLHLLEKKSKTNAPVHQKSQDSIIAATIEYVRGISMVKSFNQQGVSFSGIKKAYNESKGINIKIEKDYVIYNMLHLFSLKASSILIVLCASILTIYGKMDVPTMLMIDIFSFIVFSSAENLNNSAHVLEIIDKTLDKLENIENSKFIDVNSSDIKPSSYDMELKNVFFAYEDKEILNNVNFVITEKKVTAIVGPSGSGKTTICNLLARFYDVSKGSIKLGNRDLRDYTCDSLLRNFSMVFQKVYLFNDSILNNIKFGKPEASFEEVVKAAKKARCHEFIMSLPEQYNTVVNEGGDSLSGGEKQRISIARAILKDSPIIILDEATASVDPENEFYIQEAINSLIRNKTVVIIAHRLATIQNADQIVVVDNGRVVQKGTHNELISEKGIYKKFIDIREKAEGWRISKTM